MSNKKQNDSDEKPVWERVLKLVLEHMTLAGIAAVITAIAGLIAIVWPDIGPILFPTPTSIVSPTATGVPVPPSPTSTTTPSPTATHTPTPTLTPTPTPSPTPIPLADQFDEFDDFTGMVLDPSRWHIEGGTASLVTDGSLFLNVASGEEWVDAAVYARLDDRETRVVAAEVVVLEGTCPGQAGIVASQGPEGEHESYVNFGILYDGDIYLQQGTLDDPEVRWSGFWPGDVGEPHVLRIEWTGTEVSFEADGTRLKTLESDKPLRWFGLLAGARAFGYIEDRFNWVGWDWHP